MMKATITETPLYVRVADMRQETTTVRSYRLTSLDGSALPAFSAGAHVGVFLPFGMMRSYSLCSSPRELSSYVIAVQRQDDGRQGSKIIHDSLRPGRIVKLKPARNLFPLVSARLHTLVASGIGITPFLSMIDELEHRGSKYRLIFSGRSLKETPFAARLMELRARGMADLYIGDVRAERPDLARLLADVHPDHHLYMCGSPRFMNEVRRAATHWPRGNVHSESFCGPASVTGESAFSVEAKRSARTIKVAADQTLLAALRAHGIVVDSVCENGTCGTCKVRCLSGTPDHRDGVLVDRERRHFIITCVSRSSGPTLTLDI